MKHLQVHATSTEQHDHRGFTLLEMIVVVVVLGIIASMAIPRLSGTRDRVFELKVDQAADLMVMFAHRLSTSSKATGLQYDAPNRKLYLLTLETDQDTHESFWIDDPLSPPVVFPNWMEEESLAIFTDGEYADTSQWPLTTMPGENRPIIELSIEWDDRFATIMLAPHAMAPSLWLDEDGEEPLTPIDLDAAGQSREEW
ncbi:MAG: type II secretion system protein [Phycisphaerales bacterium]|jgi:prepilin-type N-terminal cleavage/methylation domain-containing protein|nr:type II secretion system protein [Phycisphaerales bacterium]